MTTRCPFDVFVGDGRFDENGGDFLFHEKGNESFDVLDSGFGLGAHALNATHLDAVGSGEIVEGVVGGDENSLRFGDGGDGSSGVVVEPGETLLVGGGVLLVGIGMGRIKFTKGALDDGDRFFPAAHVHPDVGVIVFGLVADDVVGVVENGLGYGEDLFPRSGETHENIAHFPFEHETVVKDEIGGLERFHIRAGGFVEVRIHPFSDEAVDDGPVARHLADDVGDHLHRGDHLVGAAAGFFLWSAGGKGKGGEQGEAKERASEERVHDSDVGIF